MILSWHSSNWKDDGISLLVAGSASVSNCSGVTSCSRSFRCLDGMRCFALRPNWPSMRWCLCDSNREHNSVASSHTLNPSDPTIDSDDSSRCVDRNWLSEVSPTLNPSVPTLNPSDPPIDSDDSSICVDRNWLSEVSPTLNPSEAKPPSYRFGRQFEMRRSVLVVRGDAQT